MPNKLKNNEILQTVLSSSYGDMEVNIDSYFLRVMDEIENYKDVDLPENINGTLRPYQKRGFSWLVQNTFMNFGSILADDMGLGKTLQILTTILHFKNNNYLNDKKVLVIVPTAILLNWENEIKKFTPNLTSIIYHGNNRDIDPETDIIITSYGMIRADFEIFGGKKWFLIVVDEAQNIKNPGSKQTQLIKKLVAEHRIALTGTPVENRLTDYWSIFDFTNKSYLEGHKKFKADFINPIEKDRDLDILEKFKKITSPFILRRLKTDKTIIDDLPDKLENECYCYLTKDQATLYQKTIDTVLNEIQNSEGIERKGLVLKLINSLKQICNHPSQFTKSKKFSIKQSGKMEMLIDILENIEENKEKSVIFTQFVQMGNIMVELLEKHFNMNILFYRGGLTCKSHDKMIDDFQNNPELRIMIVSLKAGGTGLNLTAATNAIHYDLWWNPAVENQATDRVYRIGQRKNVMVYRFISSGTFEEEINKILSNKKELAGITVGTGENFVTEMNNEELKSLFALRKTGI
ncbi:MAG: DEAD/DEAH box helicase [Methanobrevibacter sp.]|jgi:SNF2 family DNA or RNA helicase|nr:DEAD/DEAH box helicase [Candidatus Methanovirga procula]